MISYIFKNKAKNILMIVFTVLHIICSNTFRELYYSIINSSAMSFFAILTFIAFALILLYMFTLKMQYKFKEWLFPAAFAILTLLSVYELVADIIHNLSTYDYFILIDLLSYSSYLVSIVAYTFCFIGSIKNFKNVVFLKAGALVKITGTVLTTSTAAIIEFVAVGGMEYFKNIDEIYRVYVYKAMFENAVVWIIILLFYVGLLLLTLNKKSENIDITPFVEERRAKSTAKRAAKLQQKQEAEARLNAPSPEIPEGSWRCMACGKILSNDIDRCECGYKK